MTQRIAQREQDREAAAPKEPPKTKPPKTNPPKTDTRRADWDYKLRRAELWEAGKKLAAPSFSEDAVAQG